MRAFLFASATAAILGLRRCGQARQPPFRLIRAALQAQQHGACSVYQQRTQIRIAALADPQQTLFAARESWRGTKPNHAANCRPFLNVFASPMLATSALAVMGPMPGIASRRWLCALLRCHALICSSNSLTWRSSSRK